MTNLAAVNDDNYQPIGGASRGPKKHRFLKNRTKYAS